MRFVFRLVFVAFFFTAAMLFAACLRNANDRIFNRLCAARVSQSRLKQQLAAKQLRLENLINPASIYKQMDSAGGGPVLK
jgi:hypothetical protein